MLKASYEIFLISYTVCSPFLFMWFHKRVLKEKWDGDGADFITAAAYITSNIMAQILMYFIQEGY